MRLLVPQTASLEDAGPVTQARRVQRRSQESRQSRLERWQKVHELFGQGYFKKKFKKEIARLKGAGLPRLCERCPGLRGPAAPAGDDAGREAGGANRPLTAGALLAAGPAGAAQAG